MHLHDLKLFPLFAEASWSLLHSHSRAPLLRISLLMESFELSAQSNPTPVAVEEAVMS